MQRKSTRLVAVIIALLMIMSVIPMNVFAAIANWADTNVVFSGTSFGTNGYYNVISKKDYVLVPGAAVESEIVLNNSTGTRRQVIHVIEVDPSNPDVSIVPGYYQIDKDLTNEANWSHKELTEMAKYYENNLGYNIVGGMNTDLYYSSYSPRVLVYNGKSIGNFGKNVATDGAVLNSTSSILYVFKDAEGNISCDVKAFNLNDFNKYLEEGILLHAVGVSFGMVVNDGKLVNSTEKRGNDDAARSMVGVKPDGTLVLCMNDGRGANNSVGFSSYEEGEAMLALGCQWAANCDGGGSSTFISKRVGEDDFTMRSVPCDGAQRPTAHGVFVASNVAPTGILDVVNVDADYDIFAPNTVYSFEAEAIDTHGYAMDMPANATWALSDASFGTVSDGVFTSNGKKGEVDVQIILDDAVVGSKTITVADPVTFMLSATSTVIPYSTADKVRTITLPIVAKNGEADVFIDTNAVSLTLADSKAGTLNGFKFTATTDTSIAGTEIKVVYGTTELIYEVSFGKGSEVIYDFEDGDKAGFMGFEEAKKWSLDNNVNNTLVGSSPLAGQFNEYLSSKTYTASSADGGQVRNGNYALAWSLDNTDAAFASWSYNVLFNAGETIVLRDVANGKLATTLGMWVYIPEGAAGLALQSQLYSKNSDGTYSCKQDHFMFTSALTGNATNLNSAKEEDIPESRWVYATIDISKYDYLCTPIATDEGNSRSPSFIRTYVKPTVPATLTFYIDDITLDYSSAVDDRVLPTISNTTYSTSDTALSLENGTVITGNKVAFSAKVSDNLALDNSTGKILVDGNVIESTVAGGMLSSAEDTNLIAGVHTVTFEIKDELGNPAKATRTFTIAGDASVELAGHNESGEAPKAQSIYYVDVNVADLNNISKVEATLKLHNANSWETEGAVVADGFNATFDYNEISELLTVIVEAEDISKVKAAGQTLISIPVRVWTYDRFNFVTEEFYDPAAYTGNKPVVNVECDVVYGKVEFADKTSSAFGGLVNVATELTTISSPYHIHDNELTELNNDATCTENGYTGRTYCESCKSVVDWGTVTKPLGHAYKVDIDNREIVCDCGYTLNTTGLVDVNGVNYYLIAGKLVSGWQNVDNVQYCFDKTTYAGLEGTYISYDICATSQTFNMSFTNGKLDSGVWVKMPGGTRYYYGNTYYGQSIQTIDGKVYGFNNSGYRYEGICVIKWNPKSNYQLFEYTSDGVYVGELYESGVYTTSNGDIYYLTDGIASAPGLVKDTDGSYYYFNPSNYKAVKNSSLYLTDTNDLLPAGWYNFGDDGKLIIKQGIIKDEDGEIRYYVDGVSVYAGLVRDTDGSYYYISGNGCVAIKNRSYYITFTNGLLPVGTYTFGDDCKMIIKQGIVKDADGEIRYYVDGTSVYAGLVKDTDGSYYYISGNGCVAIKNRVYYISEAKANGLLPAGNYTFGADGKMIIKNGIVKDNDGYIRYYVNGVSTIPGLVQDNEGYFYYISGNGAVAIVNRTYYISEAKANGLLPAGNYKFGEDGRMIIKQGVVQDADGYIRYYVNGVSTIPGLVKDREGNYYYISGNGGVAIKDKTYYVSEAKANGLLPAGNYKFGSDCKMIIE